MKKWNLSISIALIAIATAMCVILGFGIEQPTVFTSVSGWAILGIWHVMILVDELRK